MNICKLKLTKKTFLIILIIIISAILRFNQLNTLEVMTDEGNYAFRSIGWNDFMMSTTLTTPWNWFMDKDALPWWTNLSFNDHPPLHFAAIWLSTAIFGVHLWAVRLPAALCGIASVLLVIIILQQFKMKRAGLWAGAFMAVLPWHIFISRQAIQESQLIFFMLLAIWLFLKAEKNKLWYWWLIAGTSFGLAILTKYSAIVLIPLLIFWYIYKKWYKKILFYIAPVATLIMLSPVIIFNYFTYAERKHFDLQFSRFFKMDTSKDWVASVQMLWQGDWRSVMAFLENLSIWISLPASLILLFGFLSVLIKKRKINLNPFIVGYGMIVAVGFIMLLTLGDFGRGSIIIPFIAIGFGISAFLISTKFNVEKNNNQNKYLQNFHIIGLIFNIACIGILLIASIGDNYGKLLFSPKILYSFYREPAGYNIYNTWFYDNFNPVLEKKHYKSFSDWLLFQVENINNSEEPIIVYDKRINWFALNWYFYVHSMYTTNIPIVHSSIFGILLKNKALNINNKIIYYVQVSDASQDTKATLDDDSLTTDQAFHKLYDKQRLEPPVMLYNGKGENILNIFKIKWENI